MVHEAAFLERGRPGKTPGKGAGLDDEGRLSRNGGRIFLGKRNAWRQEKKG